MGRSGRSPHHTAAACVAALGAASHAGFGCVRFANRPRPQPQPRLYDAVGAPSWVKATLHGAAANVAFLALPAREPSPCSLRVSPLVQSTLWSRAIPLHYPLHGSTLWSAPCVTPGPSLAERPSREYVEERADCCGAVLLVAQCCLPRCRKPGHASSRRLCQYRSVADARHARAPRKGRYAAGWARRSATRRAVRLVATWPREPCERVCGHCRGVRVGRINFLLLAVTFARAFVLTSACTTPLVRCGGELCSVSRPTS